MAIDAEERAVLEIISEALPLKRSKIIEGYDRMIVSLSKFLTDEDFDALWEFVQGVAAISIEAESWLKFAKPLAARIMHEHKELAPRIALSIMDMLEGK